MLVKESGCYYESCQSLMTKKLQDITGLHQVQIQNERVNDKWTNISLKRKDWKLQLASAMQRRRKPENEKIY